MTQLPSLYLMHDIDQRLRTQRADHAATRRAALGPIPVAQRPRPFRRHVIALRETVEVARLGDHAAHRQAA